MLTLRERREASQASPEPTHVQNKLKKRCWQLLNTLETTSFDDTGTFINTRRSGTEISTNCDGHLRRSARDTAAHARASDATATASMFSTHCHCSHALRFRPPRTPRARPTPAYTGTCSCNCFAYPEREGPGHA